MQFSLAKIKLKGWCSGDQLLFLSVIKDYQIVSYTVERHIIWYYDE
ncbi:hypothetical protein N7X57_02090 [Lactiplantibacillus paraplantarum]|nr:hypothetical protein [Lactiplantibacillus paraplantarum]ERL43618.1 hypothetical protein N644_2161 [Lactiplantibacillus paraplantarum]MCW1909263.1 hypothetical protein [Lactiplantibacillus paraplantarum]